MQLSTQQCHELLETCFPQKYNTDDFRNMAYPNINFSAKQICTRFTDFNYIAANCAFIYDSSHFNKTGCHKSTYEETVEEGNSMMVLLHVDRNAHNHFGDYAAKHMHNHHVAITSGTSVTDETKPPWYITGFGSQHLEQWAKEGIDIDHYVKYNKNKYSMMYVICHDNVAYTIMLLSHIKIKPSHYMNYSHVPKLGVGECGFSKLCWKLITNHNQFVIEQTVKIYKDPITNLVDLHIPKIHKPVDKSSYKQYCSELSTCLNIVNTLAHLYPHIAQKLKTKIDNMLSVVHVPNGISDEIPSDEISDEISMS